MRTVVSAAPDKLFDQPILRSTSWQDYDVFVVSEARALRSVQKRFEPRIGFTRPVAASAVASSDEASVGKSSKWL